MKRVRVVAVLLCVAIVVVQFFRPEKILAVDQSANSIAKNFVVTSEVQSILERSCYDCHSNTTHYPWYAEIMPVGWWLNSHINAGKQGLNFDAFSGYRPSKQYRRFKQIEDEIAKGDMPLPSYTFIHRNAVLTVDEKDRMSRWVEAMRDSMRAHYPADSLERKRSQ